MERCIAIAQNGAGRVAPNPMVGCVIVKDDRVIAEGWHKEYGGAHAEVNALNALSDGRIPSDATVYVSLEPCAHHGKTPPCADMLVNKGARKVVIGANDPFKEVDGAGIRKLRDAGVDVITGVLESECRKSNASFFTFVEKQRPFITLKWAQTPDGFIAPLEQSERRSFRISAQETDMIVHRWRSEHMGILVGSQTALKDDPGLDVRLVNGRNPIRMVFDRDGIVPANSKLFDDRAPTWVFGSRNGIDDISLSNLDDPLEALLKTCFDRNINSVLVEGGRELLTYFITSGIWDEARVITGASRLYKGIAAPKFNEPLAAEYRSGPDTIRIYHNGS